MAHAKQQKPGCRDIRVFGEVSGWAGYLQTLIFLMMTLP
jgi:hypothetical protein